MVRLSVQLLGGSYERWILRAKKYAVNVFWLMAEKGFALAAGMVVGIYVARYLHPTSYGLLSYATGFVGVFSALSTLGLDQIVVRELAKDETKRNALLGTGLLLKLGGSLVLIAIMSVLMLFMNHDGVVNLMIVVIAISETFRCFEVINYYYQSQVKSKYAVWTQLGINLLVSILKIVMVFMEAGLVWFAVAVLINTFLNAIGYIYTYTITTGRISSWTVSKKLAGTLLIESWPLALYGIALHIQARIDQVMLGQLLPSAEVGQYSVALKVIEIFGFIPMVLMSTFTPAITRARGIDLNLYHQRLLNFYRMMFLIFLITAVPLFFGAQPLVTWLYGEEYSAAGYLLSLFALRLFFSNMGVGKSVFIVNESMFVYSLMTVIVGAISNIALNWWLIPKYGTIGAVTASMLSFTISIFLIDLLFQKARLNSRLMWKGILSFWKLKEVS